MAEQVRLEIIVGSKGGVIVNQLAKGLVKVDQSARKAQAAIGKVGKSISSGVGIGLGISLLAAAQAAFREMIAVGPRFDAAMTKSLAIMGDVSEVLREDMVEAAREVGRETSFSADQAAESFFFLASAGLSAEQSIASLPQVASFAQAGMFDMARATDLLTDAQSALGLSSDDAAENLENMTELSDVLVKANTIANASVEQFAEALTNRAAAGMRLLGVELEEGVGALAALADQGVKGAVAGSQLDIVFRNLRSSASKNADAFERFNITVFDEGTGKFAGLTNVIEDMENALGGMSDETKTATLLQLGFGDKAQATLLQLLGTSEAIRGYTSDLRDSAGTTREVAEKQLNNLTAQLGLLGDAFVDFALEASGGVTPFLTDFVKTIRTEVLPVVADFVREMGRGLLPILKDVASILTGTLVPALKLAAEGWGEMFDIVAQTATGGQFAGVSDEVNRTRLVFDALRATWVSAKLIFLGFVRAIIEGELKLANLGNTLADAATSTLDFAKDEAAGVGRILTGDFSGPKVETPKPSEGVGTGLRDDLKLLDAQIRETQKELDILGATSLDNLENGANRSADAIGEIGTAAGDAANEVAAATAAAAVEAAAGTAAAAAEAAAELEAFEKRVVDLVDTLGGLNEEDIASGINDLATAWRKIQSEGQGTKQSVKAVRDEIDLLIEAGAEALPILSAVFGTTEIPINRELSASLMQFQTDVANPDLIGSPFLQLQGQILSVRGAIQSDKDAVEALVKAADEGMRDASEATRDWGQALQNVASQLEIFGSFGAILSQLAGGIAGLGAGLDQIKIPEGKDGIGGFFSGGIGNALGNIGGAFQLGGAALGIGKAIFGLFGSSPVEKAVKEVGKQMGVDISEALAESIAATSDRLGVGLREASLLALDEVIAESGRSASEFGDEVNSLMEAAALGVVPLTEALETVGSVFQTLTDESFTLGEVADASIARIVQRARELGQVIPEVEAFLEANRQLAVEGVGTGLEGIEPVTAEQFQAQAEIASFVFWDTFQKEGLLAAAAAFDKTLPALRERLEEFGGDAGVIDALIGPIIQLSELAGNELFRGAAEGAQGFSDVLAGITNQQLPLSTEQFGAFGIQAGAAFDQALLAAQESGLGMEEAQTQALLAIVPLLQTIQDAAAQYGFEIDANTQSLISQAEANGIAFATDPQDRLIASIDALTVAMGGIPPKFDEIGESAERFGERGGDAMTGLGDEAAAAADEIGAGGAEAAAAAEDLASAVSEGAVALMGQADAAAAAFSTDPTDAMRTSVEGLTGDLAGVIPVIRQIGAEITALPSFPSVPGGGGGGGGGEPPTSFATGDIVRHTPGGTVGVLGEAGQDELAAPVQAFSRQLAADLAAVVGAGGGGGGQMVVHAIVTVDGEAIGSVVQRKLDSNEIVVPDNARVDRVQ